VPVDTDNSVNARLEPVCEGVDGHSRTSSTATWGHRGEEPGADEEEVSDVRR